MPELSQCEKPLVGTPRVVICVATYRRPDQLKLLLDSLGGLIIDETAANIELLIVDNDVNESARQVCNASVLPWPVRYFVEARRGIAQARNAAVRHSAGADWIAFVDDDEMVEPLWLDNLVRTKLKYQVEIVAGPVVPRYQTGVPKWIIQSGICNRQRHPTGSQPNIPGTGNVLISSDVFRRIGLFDERFGLTGGEDSEFFVRAGQAGCKAAWCDEALVHESVGPERTSMAYLLLREYQGASLNSRAEMTCNQGILTCANRATKAILRICQGILALPLAALFGMPALTQALMRVSLGAGMLGGLFGIAFEVYRDPESTL